MCLQQIFQFLGFACGVFSAAVWQRTWCAGSPKRVATLPQGSIVDALYWSQQTFLCRNFCAGAKQLL
jgi:hypothetical protein